MSNHSKRAKHQTCQHNSPVCINHYELIRKYRCGDCGSVMMCSCDEVFARQFLSYQLAEGTEFKTKRRIPVTLGFQPRICAECRGLPAEPAPKAEGYGRSSKIKRYYWRELFFDKKKKVASWDEAHPMASQTDRRTAHLAIEKEVLEDIKSLHATKPKYVISEPSQESILKRYCVEVVPITAKYVETGEKGAVIKDGDDAISPEAFVARKFAEAGWSAMPLESLPFHALFGVMMWLLIQDSADPQVRMIGFGDRHAFLPDDFGSEGYHDRQKDAVAQHFNTLPVDRAELLWIFDYWRGHSADLRQYLWAHREYDVNRARRLIEILSPNQILAILRYLLDNYWGHYLGWPDLLLYRNSEVLFLEVKSSNDRLSQAQKRWIAGNHDRLHLPFKIVKLHRASS